MIPYPVADLTVAIAVSYKFYGQGKEICVARGGADSMDNSIQVYDILGDDMN